MRSLLIASVVLYTNNIMISAAMQLIFQQHAEDTGHANAHAFMAAKCQHGQLSSAELQSNKSQKQHGCEDKGVHGGVSMCWSHVEFGMFPELLDAR